MRRKSRFPPKLNGEAQWEEEINKWTKLDDLPAEILLLQTNNSTILHNSEEENQSPPITVALQTFPDKSPPSKLSDLEKLLEEQNKILETLGKKSSPQSSVTINSSTEIVQTSHVDHSEIVLHLQQEILKLESEIKILKDRLDLSEIQIPQTPSEKDSIIKDLKTENTVLRFKVNKIQSFVDEIVSSDSEILQDDKKKVIFPEDPEIILLENCNENITRMDLNDSQTGIISKKIDSNCNIFPENKKIDSKSDLIIEILKSNLKKNNKQIAQYMEEVDEKNKQIEKIRGIESVLTRKIEEIETENYKLSQEKRKNLEKIQELEKFLQEHNFKQNDENVKNMIIEQQKKIEEMFQQVNALNNQITLIENTKKQEETVRNKEITEKNLLITKLNKCIEQSNKTLKECETELIQMNKKIEDISTENQKLITQNKKLKLKLLSAENSYKPNINDNQSLIRSNLKNSVERLTEENGKLIDMIKALINELEKKISEINQQKNGIDLNSFTSELIESLSQFTTIDINENCRNTLEKNRDPFENEVKSSKSEPSLGTNSNSCVFPCLDPEKNIRTENITLFEDIVPTESYKTSETICQPELTPIPEETQDNLSINSGKLEKIVRTNIKIYTNKPKNSNQPGTSKNNYSPNSSVNRCFTPKPESNTKSKCCQNCTQKAKSDMGAYCVRKK